MIKLEILQYSYWEHFKLAKELSLILPIEHTRRKEIEEQVNILQKRIEQLKNESE